MKSKKPEPQRKPRIMRVNPKNAAPSIELLNSQTLFEDRIKFSWIRRRGSITQGGFPDGRIAQWLSATDLRTFARSQDILYDATDFLIPTPPNRDGIKNVWEPISQLIRDISKLDAINQDPPLKDEFEITIRSTWIRAGRPHAKDDVEFFDFLRKCQRLGRDYKADHPPVTCVWAGGNGENTEQYCWVYQEAFVNWLSNPAANHKHYPWDDVRKALLMLNFRPCRLHRSFDGESVNVRVWRGPLDLLVDDETQTRNSEDV